jgi:voltage-gated sodium channel
VVVCICVAGVLVGVQSYPSMDGNPILAVLDVLVQVVFTVECGVKIFAEGTRPLAYWTGPERGWNNFDFWLVFICWLPFDGGNVAFLRLLRLMRLLKLVGKVKQLQVIVMGLAKGLGSVSYIMLLMLLVFYLFAVLGLVYAGFPFILVARDHPSVISFLNTLSFVFSVQCFRKNDPFHFGGLGIAMISLFRCATLEDWSDIMYINIFGCDSAIGGVSGAYYGLGGADPWDALGRRNVRFQTQVGSFHLNECWHPTPQPLLAATFFISFILIAAFVMLSLFVGAVCGGMSDAMDAFKAQEEVQAYITASSHASSFLKLLCDAPFLSVSGGAQGAAAAAGSGSAESGRQKRHGVGPFARGDAGRVRGVRRGRVGRDRRRRASASDARHGRGGDAGHLQGNGRAFGQGRLRDAGICGICLHDDGRRAAGGTLVNVT